MKTDDGILNKIYEKLRVPNADRIFYIGDAIRANVGIDKIYELTKIDRWFLHNIKEIIDLEREIVKRRPQLSGELLVTAKQFGFSDKQISNLSGRPEEDIYSLRKSHNVNPVFKLVDTCAAEFKAHTPYYYSTYDR